jgi:hypothetical protein
VRARRRKAIYVESLISCDVDELWQCTQDPVSHARWDLRFGRIVHRPQSDSTQQFEYSTQVVPGVRISGTCEALGDRTRPDGSLWSGLKFASADRRSIIEKGAGYWRYIPTAGGVRFLTRYDYVPRWGRLGDAIDRIAFRPLFGWATAWSFDRLRLWLESGVTPERSRNQAIAHASAVGALALVWAWQGLVPKLLVRDSGELELLGAIHLFRGHEAQLLTAIGIGEMLFAVAIAARSRQRWPFVANLAVLPVLTIGALRANPREFTRPFNPAGLNVALAGLAAVALATRHELPSGRTPLRTAPDVQPEVDALP